MAEIGTTILKYVLASASLMAVILMPMSEKPSLNQIILVSLMNKD